MNLEELSSNEYHKGTHDQIVQQVIQRLEESGLYDCIKHNVEYVLKGNQYGEADVLAKSGKKYFAFEIKSSPKKKNKAYQQLDKDERLLQRCNPDKVYKFHVYKLGPKFEPLYMRRK